MTARLAGWALALALLVPWGAPRRAPEASIARRLLGPIAALAASAVWVRFELEVDAGRFELAYAFAGLALELDPGSAAGWYALAAHLAFDRTRAEREPDPARRRRWLEAALEVLERGERRARRPARVALSRGLLYRHVAELQALEPKLGWPGGERAALEASARAFERAAELGYEEAREYARRVRELAAEADG